jgi:hypothetical protein
MRRTVRAAHALLAAALLALTGCQKFSLDKEYELDVGSDQTVEVDPPSHEQKVVVTVSSPGVPVTSYLVLKKDVEAARRALETRKAPADYLARKESAEEATLEGTIPAKNGYAVVIGGVNKKAKVRVKINAK